MDRAEFHSIALRWDRQSLSFHECSFRDLSLSPMDLGTLYGAIVVERLRTFGGRAPDWLPHWKRLQIGCDAIGIRHACTAELFGQGLERLLQANRSWRMSEPDVSLVAVATPGNPEFGLGDCTLFLHLLQIPWNRLRTWHRDGTSLVSSPYSTGAGTSWPSPIKVRSRLAYYLADHETGSEQLRKLGLLRTSRGAIADTSVANILLINQQGEWISPSPESVMIGTTLRWCESLLADEQTEITFRDVSFEELRGAREAILVGNTPCVWHASELDGSPIGDGNIGPKCQWLQGLWIRRCGFDWLSQAMRTDYRTE